MTDKTYIAIDLKSFYASVECVQRKLDPLNTNLVVADESRTEKTICLAVSPSLKAYGIPGRIRLFELIQKTREVNAKRREKASYHCFTGKSVLDSELKNNPDLELDYIIAKPQMALYMKVSSQIFSIYLRYFAPEDIHLYSVDEVFIDVSAYLSTYKMTAYQLTMKIIHEILSETGITATAGIGTNLYLCKIAMDIEAKHIPADKDGVRIASLDEMSYRRKLWTHRPLKDFWRIGPGISRTLEANEMFTMGDIARMSVKNEGLLYKLFGVNAELIIDHAWGWEPCTVADIKAYRPERKSLSYGQVLSTPYSFEKARLIVREMADNLALDLTEQNLTSNQIVLTICYDTCNLKDTKIKEKYKGAVVTDYYGRQIPKPAHGTINIGRYTSSEKTIVENSIELYEQITDRILFVKRIYIVANNTVSRENAVKLNTEIQPDLFDNTSQNTETENRENADRRRQLAIIALKNKFGKNTIMKASDLEEGATAMERNRQVGGHNAE